MRSFRLQLNLILFFYLSASLYGQRTEEWANERMWGSGDPDFEITEIPEKWKYESAVILCRSSNYEYRKQAMAAKVNNDYYFRQRLKLLDKAAVDEYSEFAFEKLGNTQNSRDGIFLGIKIIKPDGTEKVINIEDAVQMQKYRNSRERRTMGDGYSKLAIPDLEIGDIIDYYYVSINTASTKFSGKPNRYEFDPVFIILTDEYPVVKGKLGFLTERRCFINLSVSNGAPKPVKQTRYDKDYWVVTYGDLEKSKTELWTYPYRQEPTIKFQVIVSPSDISPWEKHFLGKPEIPKTSVSDKEYLRLLKVLTCYPVKNTRLDAAASKFIKKQRKSNDPATMIEDLFYFFRHYLYFNYRNFYAERYPNYYYFDRFDFIESFSKILKTYDIEHFVFLGVPQAIGTIDNTVILAEIVPGIRVNINNKPVYIYEPGAYTVFGEGEYTMENTEIIGTEVIKKMKMPILVRDSIPAVHPKDNYQHDSIRVCFDTVQDNSLHIFYHFSTSRGLKELFQELVLIPDDYLNDEYNQHRKIKHYKKSELDEMRTKLQEASRKEEKYSDFRNEALKEWVMQSLHVDEMEIKNFKLHKQGRFTETPNLVFDFEILTKEPVKESGNYLIVEAGKLVGQNVDLSPDEKAREKDI
nr:DUF3857 domain-containing protein [Bacteroidota bacterium]